MKIEFDHTNLASDFENIDSYNSVTRFEINRILKDIEDRISNGDSYGSIRDINGNTIGKWSIETK